MPKQITGHLFCRRVYDVVRCIPRGQVATYGYVAMLAGAPQHARQVGWALRHLPEYLAWPEGGGGRYASRRREHRDAVESDFWDGVETQVPWHRVVNAQGRVSPRLDPNGLARQIELLRGEGIDVADDGRLVAGLAALAWLPDHSLSETFEPRSAL